MDIALWIAAGFVAAAFLAAGATKLATPRPQLVEKMGWVEDATDGQVKALGAIEVLAAVGLVLPAVTDIAPVLVPIAAVGAAITMAGAVVVHLRRYEGPMAVPAVVLLGLALFVAWGRFGAHAF